MPRFNFSSYISKNSLTDFSSLHDLDPQADWEQQHKENQSTSRSESHEEHVVPSMPSTTSTEVDRRLVTELNTLTGCAYSLEELGLTGKTISPSSTDGDISMDIRNKKTEKGFQCLDNIQVEMLEEQDSECFLPSQSMEDNQSARTKQYQERKKESQKAQSKQDKPSSSGSKKYTQESANDSRSSSPRSTPTENQTNFKSEPSTSRPQQSSRAKSPPCNARETPLRLVVKTEQSEYKDKDESVSGIMYLDNNNFLHPVRHANDIKDLVSVYKYESVPPLPYVVEEGLNRVQNIPFEQVVHFANLGDYVRHLQANERICDVTIHIGEEKFAAHRMCLACYSDYFADIFYGRNDKQRVPLTIRLKGIKPRAFEILLNFIYTGVLDVTGEIIGDLMTMAESLKIPVVKTKVVDYLESLPLAPAMGMLLKENIFGPMYDRAMNSVCEQFSTFRFESVFLELDIETLFVILSSDNINITSELDVFKAAIMWIAHNMMHRKKFLLKLMQCVRFVFMTHSELFQCTEMTDLLQDNYECKQMLLEANWCITSRILGKDDPFNLKVPKPRIATTHTPLPTDEDKFYSAHSFAQLDVEVNSPVTTPRQQASSPEDVLVVGGFNPTSSRAAILAKAIDRYSCSSNEWDHFSDLPGPRIHYAVTMLHGKLYLTGGVDPREKVKHPMPTADAFVFDTKSQVWSDIMPMNTPRMYHSLISVYGMVYAIGGQDHEYRVSDTVECYNPMTDNWFFVKPMSVARLGAAIGVLDGKIFVAGGYGEMVSEKYGKPILDSVECFDPRTNRWETKNKLRFCRCHAKIATANNRMYLLGGATRPSNTIDAVIHSTSSVHVYNAQRDLWEHVSDMVVPRHDAGTTAIGNLIYIMGGASTESNRILRSVECFDTDTKSWIRGVKDLPYPSKWVHCLSVNFD